jgi:hypothetical protein
MDGRERHDTVARALLPMTLKVRRFDRESQATGPGWIRDQSFTRAKISKHSFDKRVVNGGGKSGQRGTA